MIKLLEIYVESLEGTGKYPTKKWLKSQLGWGLQASLNKTQLAKIRDMKIVGSTARGADRPDSDIDVAVIMEPTRGKTSVKFTDHFHSNYTSDADKPKFNGRVIDFQFFWTTDTDWQEYDKIELV